VAGDGTNPVLYQPRTITYLECIFKLDKFTRPEKKKDLNLIIWPRNVLKIFVVIMGRNWATLWPDKTSAATKNREETEREKRNM
jgi:hypothetical protein